MSYQTKDRTRFSRAQWMEKYETECIRLCPRVRGKVDWDTADYYYLHGYDAREAAKRWIGKEAEVA